jgi:hypothetical protein
LTAAGYQPTFTVAGNATRNLSYFVYTYNLLGEFCAAPFNVTATIPTPTVSALSVDETTGKIIWTGANASLYKVEVATDAGYATILINKTVPEQSFHLDDENMLRQRYFRVTPQDTLGSGAAVTTSHTHTPAGVGLWTLANDIFSVPQMPSPTTDITVPANFTPWQDELLERGRQIRTRLTGTERYS